MKNSSLTNIGSESYRNCESKMRRDSEGMGYKAFCPACRKKLMLCGQCRHNPFTSGCDYGSDTSSYRRNPPGKAAKKDTRRLKNYDTP